MNDDTVSREAVKAAIERRYLNSALTRVEVNCILAAIDALPAASEDRWEKLRECIMKLSAEDDSSRNTYFDATEDVLAAMAELDGITWEQRMEQARQAPAPAEAAQRVERPKLTDLQEV